jgi:DNA-directed RNA polymerase II subunit RPB2
MSRQTEEAKKLARHLLDRYFRTMPDYLSRHHIQSYEQFIQADLPRIIRANNPFILYKSQIDPEKKRKTGEKPTYEYKVEIYIGGVNGTALKIGTPTVALQNGKEIRALFPNEARLRNLTYQSQITADITVRITYNPDGPSNKEISEDQLVQTIEIPDWNLFQMPILLHSKYCLLSGKPADFLREAGECMYDQGGYFIVEGAEKVLVTIQNPAFNTLDIHEDKANPKIKFFAKILMPLRKNSPCQACNLRCCSYYRFNPSRNSLRAKADSSLCAIPRLRYYLGPRHHSAHSTR